MKVKEKVRVERVEGGKKGYSPPVLNVEWDGRKGFCTNDLFVKHPSKEGLWKIVGRADDQIGHANGEKTNPVPMGKYFSSSSQ